MLKMEFVTTACIRPDIIDETFTTFRQHLHGVDWEGSTLYLNVDPLPEGEDPEQAVRVAARHFGRVIWRNPEEPNFTAALQWGFQKPQNPFFFYLQDDWQMVRNVNIDDLIQKLGQLGEKKVVNVVLRAYRTINDQRICLSPCLIDTVWAREYSAKLDIKLNPERQFRPKSKVNQGGGQASNPNCVGIQFGQQRIVRDLGRDWLRKNKYKRNALKWQFNTWSKIQ